MIYHGTFISDENNRFNGKYEISVPMEQIFRGSKYFVTGLYSLRNRHCPHLSLTHTGWHLKMPPYFELKLPEICIQEFKEVWEMGIRWDVDFKLFTDFSELMHYL